MKRFLLLIPVFLAILACSLSFSQVQVTPTTGPQPSGGVITGKLSYPSEFLPAMRVVAFSLTDNKAYFIDTAKNQGQFSLSVPAGTYNLVSYPYEGTAGQTGTAESYTPGGGPFGGGYTQMVPCGLQAGCEDHSLLSISVADGQTVTADPGDWYAPEGAFPPIPNP
jgi:hypothetical protein